MRNLDIPYSKGPMEKIELSKNSGYANCGKKIREKSKLLKYLLNLHPDLLANTSASIFFVI